MRFLSFLLACIAWVPLAHGASVTTFIRGPVGGGGGVGTDPAGEANRAIHLIGDDLTGADADAITSWPAATGTSNAGTGAGTGMIKKTGIANGHAVARFPGTGYVSFAATDLSAQTAGTAYVVVKLDADTPGSDSLSGLWGAFGNAPGADGTYFPYPGDGIIYDDFGTTVRKATVNPTPSLSAAFRVYAVSSASGAWVNYLDGAALITPVANTVEFVFAPKLGVSTDLTRFLDGDVAEFVIFSVAHDATKVGDISAFLMDKYNP